jgi:hypothetical protein
MRFELHPHIRFELRHIGLEKQPLVIVDNVLAKPQVLIDAACAADFYVPEHTRYPGLNARLPDDYYGLIIDALRGPMQAAFDLPSSAWLDYFGYFGLVTVRSEDAEPIQRIPHHDGPDPRQLAMVHYLSREAFGGTGFFRHKATRFETIDAYRRDRYVATAGRELEAGQGMTGYELIAEAEPVFNRLIVYRGHVLHSALPGTAPLSLDPAKGRLTANGFVRPRR